MNPFLRPVVFLFFTVTFAQVELCEWEDLFFRMNKHSDTLFVVNFWATWCQPCVQELPHLFEETEKMQSDKVCFIPVCLNFPEDYSTRVIPFVTKKFKGKKFYQLKNLLQSDDISAIHEQWTGAIPFTLLYNKKRNLKTGIERKLKRGELQRKILEVWKQSR